MKANDLVALWLLAGPIQPNDLEAVRSARLDQLCRLVVEERESLMRKLWYQAVYRQEGKEPRWLCH